MDYQFKTLFFKDDGIIPNSHLPVILYQKVCDMPDNAQWLEDCFKVNGWTNNWRNIVLSYDHFHSTTHEVLGVSRGSISLKMGGKNGQIVDVSACDVLIIPAGVGHFSVSNHVDYEIVGGYPDGLSWDLLRGTAEERKTALSRIKNLQIPSTDPVFGLEGQLLKLWNKI